MIPEFNGGLLTSMGRNPLSPIGIVIGWPAEVSGQILVVTKSTNSRATLFSSTVERISLSSKR